MSEQSMKRVLSHRPKSGRAQTVVVLAVLAIIGAVALAAVLRMDTHGDNGSGLSERFDFNVDSFMTVDPQLLTYEESGGFATGLSVVRGIATGPDDAVLVVGDDKLLILDGAGQRQREVLVKGTPTCVAAADQYYVGVDARVEIYDSQGDKLGVWEEGFNEESVLTSIAVGEEDVFVADAGNRIVLRFEREGRLLNRIGDPNEEQGVLGFVIPSPYFDVATGDDGLLRVANPGARRIETYTPDGDLLGQWGQASSDIEGFFGCCNPSHFVLLPDGRIMTSEKGIPRIKVYAGRGELKCVVAEPRQLAHSDTVATETRDEHQLKAFDIAVDSTGRVLVLDPTSGNVRVFQEKAKAEG